MPPLTPSQALAATDPVPLVMWWLQQHPGVTAALGAGHISMWNEAPYPCLRLTDTTAGSDGDLIWLISPEIQLEAYGDLDGSPGKAALRQVLYTCAGALMELAQASWPYEGAPDRSPVITWAQSSKSGGYVPLPSGQPRYIGAVRVYCHPAS
jgi:hypothetical protein